MAIQQDRFFGLIHNYIIHKQNNGATALPHPWSHIDNDLAIVCDKMEEKSSNRINDLVKYLSDKELSFPSFVDALNTILSMDNFQLDYNRTVGAIVFCGAYVQQLSKIELSGEFPDSYQNSARFRNQINQIILYMSKILDARSAELWSGGSGCTWEGFIEYITTYAEVLRDHRLVELGTYHPMAIAAVVGIVGIAGIILYRCATYSN